MCDSNVVYRPALVPGFFFAAGPQSICYYLACCVLRAAHRVSNIRLRLFPFSGRLKLGVSLTPSFALTSALVRGVNRWRPRPPNTCNIQPS